MTFGSISRYGRLIPGVHTSPNRQVIPPFFLKEVEMPPPTLVKVAEYSPILVSLYDKQPILLLPVLYILDKHEVKFLHLVPDAIIEVTIWDMCDNGSDQSPVPEVLGVEA